MYVGPRHHHPHRLPLGDLDRCPLPLMDLRPYPEHARVCHDEEPVANASPLTPRDEDILHHAVERRPQHEGAQGVGVAGAFDLVLSHGIGIQPAADKRAEIFLGDQQQPVGLLERGTGPIAILAGEKPRLLAGGGEVGLGHLQIARPLFDDPPRQHTALTQRLCSGAHLFDVDQPRIGAEDLFAIRPQHTVLKLLFDRGQRRMAVERVEQRLDVGGDGGRPVGSLLFDKPVVLATADLVAGHAHVRAGKLRQGVPLRDLLPHLHEHPRDDAIDGRRVVEPVAGVIIDSAGNGEVLTKRQDFYWCQTDVGGLLRYHRQGDDPGHGRCRRVVAFTGGLLTGRPAGIVRDTSKMMGGEPPPGQAADRQESQS